MMFAFIFKVNLVRWTVPFSQRQRMKSSDHRSDAGLAEAMQDFFTPDPNLIQKVGRGERMEGWGEFILQVLSRPWLLCLS